MRAMRGVACVALCGALACQIAERAPLPPGSSVRAAIGAGESRAWTVALAEDELLEVKLRKRVAGVRLEIIAPDGDSVWVHTAEPLRYLGPAGRYQVKIGASSAVAARATVEIERSARTAGERELRELRADRKLRLTSERWH